MRRILPGVLCLLAAASSGCLSLHDYRPAPVLVVDAETRKPIPGATVRIYPVLRSDFAPPEVMGTTGADGVARLRADARDGLVLMMDAQAKGYMTWLQNLSHDAIHKIEPVGWLGKTDRRPPAFVVEMYADPPFFVDLVVPHGYRGLVKASIDARDDVPCPPGQRGFTAVVTAAGEARVQAPPLLLRYKPAYRARYADGTPLVDDMDYIKVGFRWLKRDGADEYFVVGTQSDYDSCRRDLFAKELEARAASAHGGGGGGRKGGRRRGGAPSSEP